MSIYSKQSQANAKDPNLHQKMGVSYYMTWLPARAGSASLNDAGDSGLNMVNKQ